jgi:hypothetical protein
MARQVKTTARGNATDTGTPITPAPTRPQAPDATNVRNPTPVGYGQNGDRSRVSVDPGKTVQSPLAANLRASVGDAALDAVIAGKPIGTDGPTGQERPINPAPFPTTHSMRNRSGE